MNSRFAIAVVGGVVVVITLLVVILAISADTESAARNNPEDLERSTAPPVVRVVTVGEERRPFRFADYPGGCVVVYLNHDVMFYPLGGRIIVRTPKGKTEKISPAVPTSEQRLRGLTVGIYTVCPDSEDKPGATNVDIWTRWAVQPPGLN